MVMTEQGMGRGALDQRRRGQGEGASEFLNVVYVAANINRNDAARLLLFLLGLPVFECLFCASQCLCGTPTKRQVSKHQVSKRLVSKHPVSKRQVYKTSGLQNVRFRNVWFQNFQFLNLIYL